MTKDRDKVMMLLVCHDDGVRTSRLVGCHHLKILSGGPSKRLDYWLNMADFECGNALPCIRIAS